MRNLKRMILFVVIVVCFSVHGFVYADSTLNCQNTLYYSSQGSQVKLLQQSLNQTIGCNLSVDGIFGKNTYQCVTKFQKKYNLLVDGIVGTQTCSKLNSLTTNSGTSSNTSFSVTSSEEDSYVVVSASRLNVRKKASKSSKILNTVDQGSVLKVYGSKKSNGTTWYKIKVNEKYGYISGSYAVKNAIVLDISEQNLKLYKSGSVVMNVPVITGNEGNHDTPIGHYQLKVQNMQTSRYLSGYNDDGSTYKAYVNYWMPFITSRGIGFHDASWRTESQYNTETYLTNGSHGCVNMQSEDAATLYNEITEDIDVFVVA